MSYSCFELFFLTDLDHHDISKRPKDKFFEKVINPYLVEVLQHPQTIEMREGCCTSAMWRDQGVPEAWRQSSKLWNNKFSSAKGWWSVDLTPTR